MQSEFYWDSIWNDVADAENAVQGNPVYVILNLCRVLAYGTGGLILSKREGGEWGIANLPEKYHGLVASALQAYHSDEMFEQDDALAGNYAAYMLDRIRNCAVRGTSALEEPPCMDSLYSDISQSENRTKGVRSHGN